MKQKLYLILIIQLFLLCFAYSGNIDFTYSFSGDMEMTLEIEGVEREYFVHIPQGYNSEELFPVVFVLHGGGGNAERTGKFTGFTELSDKEKFIVVYPQGYDRHWNDGRSDIKSKAYEENINDILFFDEMIDALALLFKIDAGRIYVTGISNGAMMSFRLACELSDKITAIAAVSGSIPEDIADTCEPEKPVSVLVINGVEDELVPFDGGHVKVFNKTRGKVIPTLETIEKWVLHNKCPVKPTAVFEINTEKDDGMKVLVQEYKNKDTGVAVVLYRIEGGGHTWPGAKQYLPEYFIGKTNHDINATEVIWEFFKDKTK